MPNIQVVVDASHASRDELAACLASLSGQAGRIDVLNADPAPTLGSPSHSLIGSPRSIGDSPPSAVPDLILVTSARAVFARGAVRRLARHADRPERVVTRVFVPELNRRKAVACWSAEWARAHGMAAADLAEAGLKHDREKLPHDSPHIRHWVRADEIGVGILADVGSRFAAWAKAEDRRIRAKELYAALRARAGVLRRRRELRTQRRRLPSYQRAL